MVQLADGSIARRNIDHVRRRWEPENVNTSETGRIPDTIVTSGTATNEEDNHENNVESDLAMDTSNSTTNHSDNSQMTEPSRYPIRQRGQPKHLKDYVMSVKSCNIKKL